LPSLFAVFRSRLLSLPGHGSQDLHKETSGGYGGIEKEDLF
jgi:hypothetical protein